MRLTFTVLAVIGLIACGEAPEAPSASDATDSEAETCLRTKIWESNRDGWSVRNSGTVQLAGQAYKQFAVTLYTSREYKLLACGTGWAQEVGLQLYDPNGDRAHAVMNQGRQPAFDYKPTLGGQYFVVVQNRNSHPKTGSVSWTVLYR